MTTFTIFVLEPGASAYLADRLEERHPQWPHIDDAAVVDWPLGDDRPSTWQAPLAGTGPRGLSGAFWGLLFAHLFLLPLSTLHPILEERGADGPLTHLGLGPDQLTVIRDNVTPGTSALFVLHADDQATRLAAALGRRHRPTTAIALTTAQTQRLYAGFGEGERPQPVV